MTVRTGRGDHFRAASWLERSVARLRGGRRRAAPRVLRRLHEILLDHLPGDHLVSTLPGGERVRVSARYRQLSWNPEEYRAFREAVRPGATVLDVGANLGAYTLLFAAWAGPAGRVFAFEPAPESRAGLRKQLRLNQFVEQVEIVEAAVAGSVGMAAFTCDAASGANALDVGSAPDAIMVATTSLDAFCGTRGLNPDVIKIDVEGAELDVLKGGRATLATPGVQTFVEFHPTAWAARGIAAADIRAELASQQLVPEPLDPAIDMWNTEGISVRLRHA
jgi:FkbM family methyltransferase